MRPWKWTPKRELAAKFVARGYSVRRTAAELRVNPSTIQRWKTRPEFIHVVALQARMDRRGEVLRSEVQAQALSNCVAAAIQRFGESPPETGVELRLLKGLLREYRRLVDDRRERRLRLCRLAGLA